jgi:hypothetical protein
MSAVSSRRRAGKTAAQFYFNPFATSSVQSLAENLLARRVDVVPHFMCVVVFDPAVGAPPGIGLLDEEMPLNF